MRRYGASGPTVRKVSLRALAATVVLIALFLPLFTVRYSPPGGSAIVYRQRIGAFADKVTGLQFATAAHWTHILPAVTAILAIGIGGVLFLVLRNWALPGSVDTVEVEATVTKLLFSLGGFVSRERPSNAGDGQAKVRAGVRAIASWLSRWYQRLTETFDLDGFDFLYAVASVVVSIGWLFVLGLVVLIGVPAMPPNGEKGILAAFQTSPFSAQPPGRNDWIEPSHLHAALGLGWLVLLVGISIGVVAMWRQVAAIAFLLAIALLALRFADRTLYDAISPFLTA